MNLTEEQKSAVTTWAAEGASLGDIQKRLKDEFGIALTFLDTRIIVGELGASIADAEKKAARAKLEADLAKAAAAAEAGEDEMEITPGGPDEQGAAAGAKVRVTVDAVPPPHAIISGHATFTDGKKASWYIDQMGQLGFQPDEPGYRPPAADLQAFQMELQRVMRQEGF